MKKSSILIMAGLLLAALWTLAPITPSANAQECGTISLAQAMNGGFNPLPGEMDRDMDRDLGRDYDSDLPVSPAPDLRDRDLNEQNRNSGHDRSGEFTGDVTD